MNYVGGGEGNYFSGRKKSSAKVDIFGVHEIALIKKSNGRKSGDSQHHEATLKVWGFEWTCTVEVFQQIFVASVSECPCREEATNEKVEWVGKESRGILVATVSIENARLASYNIRVGTHIIGEQRNGSGEERKVGVEYEMNDRRVVDSLTDGNVVGASVADIFRWNICG